MDRSEGWNPLIWVLMGLLGLSLVPRPAQPPQAAETKPATTPPPVTESVVVERQEGAGWLRGALPALRLVAEHLGVGADPGVEVAGAPDAASTRDGFRSVEEALGRRPLECTDALLNEAVRVARDVQLLARTEAKGGWGELVDRAKANAEVVGLIRRATAEASRRNLDVRFVIATIPDYVDGNSGWDADQRLEAIQRAAADAKFASDRFHLPDWLPDRAAAERTALPLKHEVEPGAMVFRRYPPPQPGHAASNRLLVVLFATETATLGVHRDALLAAIALATAWSPKDDLRLIGPSFSGSSLSLRATLERAFERGLVTRRPQPGAGPVVHIISGSATASSNRAWLTEPLAASPSGAYPEVRFHSTTATDDDHLCALEQYLSSTYEGWKDGSGIAILRESNTGYGGQLRPRDGDFARCPGKLPEAYVFPFPAHISRLRAQAAGGADDTKLPSGARVHLELEEAGSTDRVPSVAPKLTSAMAEVVLGNILDGIERLGIGAVGIYATDKRDHLFLAQEISRHVPSVLIFALEGNLIYLHPDYRSYMRGTLVVGSYPLFFPTQSLAQASSRDRHQFPSMAAAGVYNALTAHLAEPKGPSDKGDPEVLSRMVDYDDCGGASGSCGPSVWIGMVGRDVLWPLTKVSRHALNEDRLEAIEAAQGRVGDAESEGKRALASLEYSWTRPPGTGESKRDLVRLPRWAALVGFLVLVAAALLSVPWWIRRALAARWPSPAVRLGLVQAGRAFDMLYPPGKDDDLPWRLFASGPRETRLAALRREHRLGYVSCAAAVLCVAFWLGTALAATYLDVPERAWTALQIANGVMVAILMVLALLALWPLARRDRPSLVRRGLVALPVLATLLAFGFSAPSPRLVGPLSTFNGQRFLTMSSLVSPTVPIFFLASAVLAWGLWRLRQVQLQSATLDAGSAVTDLAGGTLPSGGLVLVHELNYPYLHVGPWGLLLVAAAAAAQGALGWNYRHTGEGSASFGWFLWAAAILVTVLMGFTLTNATRLGRLLLAGTSALERHPLRLAFGSLQRLGLSRRYSLSPPGTEALAPLVRQAGALGNAIREDAKRVARVARPELGPAGGRANGQRATDATGESASPPPDPDCDAIANALQIRSGDVATVLRDVRMVERLGPTAAELALPPFFHASPLWPRLEALSGLLVRSLERGPWAACPFPTEAGASGTPAAPRLASHVEAETFLALQVSCVIRLVLSRVLSGLTLVVAGLVLVLCAHLFYSFPGRPFWLAWDAVLVASATTVILGLLVGLERDPILSRLAGTAPGKIGWTGGFSFRMIIYVTIALLTLFATFFPEVGSSIREWLEPVRKALP